MKLAAPLLLAPILIIAHTGPALAYLDPGTGSILLQGLLALIAGTTVTVRLYWSKLKRFFSREQPDLGVQSDQRD